MDIKQAIAHVVERQDLGHDEMLAVMRQIMTGHASDVQIAALLVALRMKGETVDEITAAATVMRELSSRVEVNTDYLVDTCGTGGDASSTFNISTASAFVVAAAGGRVAKHGNRSVSSRCGSADVLEELGVNLSLTAQQVALCVDQIGIGFMFAPNHHAAMKHAITARKEMGVRSLFNLLGPLTNPAAAPHQLIGVFDRVWLQPLAQVLKRLGSKHVLLVSSADGLDEISIGAETYCAELKEGEINTFTIAPREFDISIASLAVIKVEDAPQSASIIRAIFNGQADDGSVAQTTIAAAKDIVALNAGAAIYVAGLVDSLHSGVAKAQQLISSGVVQQRLDALIDLTVKLGAGSNIDSAGK